ncbi:MAG: threonylcarbamoyl-AMP synthase [Clostridiales bacterium]|nr:threonylcarbamoyl-AMP synthase [Clostridiales bacterium]
MEPQKGVFVLNTQHILIHTPCAGDPGILSAADILKAGGLVAIPTETVYGLAANALDETAVGHIFEAKGRPQDNPLIVHIARLEDWEPLVSDIPPKARLLAERFWPGPLTIILPKSGLIPAAVSAGLDTVAVRCPSHPAARAVIEASGLPLAAPSANTSGRPSPTCAGHVLHDLGGKIDAVLDGGECGVGLESTVISLCGDVPRLLRPGGVTAEQLRETIGEVEIDPAVLSQLQEGQTAMSPGMKYKHYSPRSRVVILDGNGEQYRAYLLSHKQEKPVALCFEEDLPLPGIPFVCYGSERSPESQAHRLFDALRQVDGLDANIVYARCPDKSGVGLAVYNRLIRAAGFEVIRL